MKRVFLGWQRSALASAVDYLWQQFMQPGGDAAQLGGDAGQPGGIWQLSDVILVLPGGRAGRRLSQLLAQRASAAGVPYFPPAVTTVGQLPERLYRAKRPFATRLVQQLAWTQALRATPSGELEQFLAELPAPEDWHRWFELATLLWRQHRELAADTLDFQAVAREGAGLAGFAETDRWRALGHVQRRYLDLLDRLQLWDRQTARLFALEHAECSATEQLILVGTVDMNLTLRRMLQQVESQVTALVFADERWADKFDALGCVIPAAWRRTTIPLREEMIQQVDSSMDQADGVIRVLSELPQEYTADQVTVGVPDVSLVPWLRERLEQFGLATRYGPGESLEATRPVRMLRVVADYLAESRVSTLLDLVRHPDVAASLRADNRSFDVDVHRLDELERAHLPTRTGDLLAIQGTPSSERLLGSVTQWLKPLLADDLQSPKQQQPAAWSDAILAVVRAVYGSAVLDPDDPAQRRTLSGCETISEACAQLQRIPAGLSPDLSASAAILMALDTIAGQQVPALPNAHAVELLGWLELPLDDAPVCIVTQMNEGVVPTSSNSDLFLPDSLRTHLGLDDNARRYARDAYSLTTLAKSRRQLHLIHARRDRQGNPLMPSRLLLATDTTRLIERCLRWFGEPGTSQAVGQDELVEAWRQVESRDVPACDAVRSRSHAAHQFFVPRPQRERHLSADGVLAETTDPSGGSKCWPILNVTDFKSYLDCPYRFFLSRVLKLKSISEPPWELDAAAFGSRLHDVLERFGASSDVRDSTDEAAIAEFLLDTLAEVFATHYGPRPRAVVQLQRAQMQQRLRAFAIQQATWRQQGWRIVFAEDASQLVAWRYDAAADPSLPETPDAAGDDSPVGLRGRIDRVDYHEGKQRYAVLDYKSSDVGHAPRKVHHRGKSPTDAADWLDLQLPMYRHVATALNLGDPDQLVLGYVTLPRAADGCRFLTADWNPAELRSADRAAWQVVRRIRAGEFWPPAETPAWRDPGLDRICQVGVFDRQLQGATS